MPSPRHAVAALLPAAVLAIDPATLLDDNQMVQLDGLIRYPVVPQLGGSPFGKSTAALSKRQFDTGSTTQQIGTLYTINVNLGTPGQSVPVQFDTGSSELWVNPTCSASSDPAFCNAQPRFTSSTTLVDLHVQGQVLYGTGGAHFEYVQDYVGIGSARITQQIFGVASSSSHAVVGILGAGPRLEGWESEADYPLVIDSLVQQTFIKSRAFSMDLRGLDSTRGSVIYGGLDTKKYTGNLVKRPIIPAAESPDGFTRFWVYLSGISVNQPDGKVVQVYSTPAGGKGQPVLLDSGYTLSALPSPIYQKLVSAFPSAKPLSSGSAYYQVDCTDPGKGGSVDFTFGDTVINVRYYDFVWHLPGTDSCVLGAFADDDFPVLGDTFLRSAYVVYDWDNRNIHLGQTADCGSHLVPISTGPNAVPSIAGECGQATSTSSSTSSTVTSTSTSSSTSSTVTSTSTSSSTSSTATSKSTSPVTSSSTSSGTTTATSTSTSTSTSHSSTASSSTTTGSSSSTSSTATTKSTTTGSSTTTTTSPATTSSSSTISKTTITYTTHTTYTVTKCPATVTHCPAGDHTTVVTEIITATTAVCPETTGTYTIRPSPSCSTCPRPPAQTVTVSPVPPASRTTQVVPGGTSGPTEPAATVTGGGNTGGVPTTLLAAPTATSGKNGTVTTGAGAKPTSTVVHAGAGKVVGGWAAVVLGAAVVGVMGL